MIISKEFTFEASHILPKHEGKCSRLHGHSWRLRVYVYGPINQRTGFVVDYGLLKALVDAHVINKLDHTHLGYGPASASGQEFIRPYFGTEFYPSSENLARAIYKLLNPLVKELGDYVGLNKIEIDETCTSRASYGAVDELDGYTEAE